MAISGQRLYRGDLRRAGYDWLLFDGEHAPNTIQTLLAQLQAVSAYPVEAVARPPVGDPVIIKQYLDIGFRSLLIPMVGSAEQARLLVPPRDIRPLVFGAWRAWSERPVSAPSRITWRKPMKIFASFCRSKAGRGLMPSRRLLLSTASMRYSWVLEIWPARLAISVNPTIRPFRLLFPMP